MANILLGVTGSVAAIRTPELVAGLRTAGHQVKLIVTRAALYFFKPSDLETSSPGPWFFRDEDEWPGREAGRLYQRDDPVLHIELRRWADLFLIAPLDANTLAKLATGLADNCLTCVWRAWDLQRPVVLAPAMNTLMWEHPLTRKHFYQLAENAQKEKVPPGLETEELLDWINASCATLKVVPPISKRLACGDVGVGAMAAVEEIAALVKDEISNLL